MFFFCDFVPLEHSIQSPPPYRRSKEYRCEGLPYRPYMSIKKSVSADTVETSSDDKNRNWRQKIRDRLSKINRKVRNLPIFSKVYNKFPRISTSNF